MRKGYTLDRLPKGRSGEILALGFTGARQRRLLELGFAPGRRITALEEGPWGDPVAYGVCGAVIALRREDAGKIEISGE